MSSNKNASLFESQGWKTGMKYLYGIGASVVIVGALFKILHLKFASEMLIVGLGTEAVIFFFSAFEPLPPDEKHYEWEKVFPQLAEDEDTPIDLPVAGGASIGAGYGKSPSLPAIPDDFFEGLSKSVSNMVANVNNMAEASDAVGAVNEFSSKLNQATSKIDALNKGYAQSVESMNAFGNSLNDVKSYQTQIQTVTKSLASLNSVYELELQDAQKHINSITKFYGSISGVMQNLLDTSKDTDALRVEVGSLATNMHTLNAIYGNMLTAMASGAKAKA